MSEQPLTEVSEQAALEHVLRHHAGADGWITLSRKEGDVYKQYHYRVDDIAGVLADWLGVDAFFSQNTFYRPSRKIEYIRELRALYVDVDCYLLNLDPEWVIGSLEANLFQDKVPDPNLIIHSGRGLALVWLLEPVPSQALPLWQAIENYLVRQLSQFGGDAKASDAARILRVAGTVNSKSHEPVLVQYRHDYRYVLRDIEREYLPPLSPAKIRERNKEEARIHQKMYRVYSLHYTRLKDIVKLCELRQWDVEGSREVILFLYRYWSCCFLTDPKEALENTVELNEQFISPLPKPEVVRATKSAEKAWKAKNDVEANLVAKERGYPGAGYNITNAKLIDWLEITDEEQRQLDTIIGRRIKYDRNNERREKGRRAAGKLTREEYIQQAEERRHKALEMRSDGMSIRRIAAQLGCSSSEVHRLVSNNN
ncbi:helix-turn-helix domain-containing protein [Alicyclobacillus sp. SO9]|uniref:helix-turn-helix domain-containing protein n=1 Tax=Alicyclobacillus sp. SO9 TaxID=2665646 RepID=UPI0018E82F0F|nr:helix-turn-helix domain-containing protein [Alicyclobacillus sp. SO9]QQE81611.1 helix-turn-helix domain-containing protein [Alicyclobacillus sp. SO9]